MANKAVGLLTFNFGANIQGFERAMNKAQKKLSKFGRNVERTGKNMTLGFTLPLGALSVQAVKTASSLEETRRKFDTVFSGISGSAERAAVRFQEAFKVSELETKTLLSNTADLLVGFGFTEESALTLSLQVNELALDLAAFNPQVENAAQASHALTNGLLGEREAMKTLGIALKETDLKTFAEEQGLVWKELDRAAKAQLTYEAAMQQTTKAQGAHVANMDTFAGTIKIMKAEFDEAASTLGTILLPYVKSFAEWLTKLLKRFQDLSPGTQSFLVTVGLIVAALGPLLIVIGRVSLGISYLIPVVSGAITKLKAMKLSWLGIAGAIGGALVALGKYLFKKKKQKKEVDAVNDAMLEAEKNIQGEITDVKVLTDVIEDHTTSLDDKKKALEKLKEISPEYYGHLDAATLTMNDLNTASEKYIANLRKQAQAEAMRSKIISLEKSKLSVIDKIRTGKTEGKLAKIFTDGKLKTLTDEELMGTLTEKFNKITEHGLGTHALTVIIKEYMDAEKQITRLMDNLVELEKAPSKGLLGSLADLFGEQLEEMGKKTNKELKELGFSVEQIKKLRHTLDQEFDPHKKKKTTTTKKTPFEIDLEKIEAQYEEALRIIKQKRALNEIDAVEFNQQIEQAELDHLKKMKDLSDQYKKDLLSAADVEKLLAGPTVVTWFEEYTEGAEEVLTWTKKITDAQKLMNGGMALIGDILTSSLTSAFESQEDFFDSFIDNIKRAIRNLLIQLAVMTVIQAIMGGPGGFKTAFATANILKNLTSIIGFADGGLVTGPTTALIGEGSGTSASNPEVVAPLDKLKQYVGGGNVEVTGVIKGNDIWLSNEKTKSNRFRTV